ncbi:MAG: ATP-binding cassette domain-containing protein [Candidatus Dormibacteraeota bacterium]|nr:ATP-binding cassette domain-containing protein [Candidatus Dormibacteraeota bacterium]
MVRMRWVSKRYKNHLALSGIDLVMLRGELVFVVGQSGSGKTTLLRLLNHEVKPSQGEIFVDGLAVHRLRWSRVPELRRHVGTVYQDYRLLPRLTARENVAFASQVQDLGVSDREARYRAEKTLELVGLGGAGDAYPDELSGGEQQRVAIARAMISRPPLLLADEPTGNLDPPTAAGIMTLLADLAEEGSSVLVVTHNLEAVQRVGRRVLVLDDGRLVAEHQRRPDSERWDDQEAFELPPSATRRLSENQA